MKLAFFDMDRTLTKEISVLFLGIAVGKEQEVLDLEARSDAKSITNKDFTENAGRIVAGITMNEFRQIYERMPLITGIRETIAELTKKGYKSIVATRGIGEFARFMCEDYGFEFYYGCSTLTEPNNGNSIVKGFGKPFPSSKGKARYVLQLCKQQGIAPKECFAVGDSLGDAKMFDLVGTGIAINYSPSLEGRATYYIKTCNDLREILKFVP